ncbi:hypothetical protein QJQ45_019747, partial [Haematococcus lacustris]
VFNAYCAKKGQDVATLRFLFDGKRIEPSSTPAMFELSAAAVVAGNDDNTLLTASARGNLPFRTKLEMRFLFDGQRVEPSSTPATHEMEDGDIIDCMIEQIGGAHGPPMLQGRRSKGISPGSA